MKHCTLAFRKSNTQKPLAVPIRQKESEFEFVLIMLTCEPEIHLALVQYTVQIYSNIMVTDVSKISSVQ